VGMQNTLKAVLIMFPCCRHLLMCTVGQTAQEAGKLCPVGMSFAMLCNFFHHKNGQNFVTT
jgi:hypothetical protein